MAKKYDGSVYRAPGRPRTATEISGLVVRMAEENRRWGYRRIQGALSNLGQILARTTIANILKRHGIDPAPERSRKTTWKEFLTRHWDQIVATDFFTVEVWTCSGLTRFIVLFLYGFVDREGANWRHRQLSKWAVDGSDCTLSNGCRGWFLRWKTIFGHRNRPAPVDGRNGRDVQLQPLNVVVERGRIRWNGRRQRSVRRPGTVAVRLHQDSLRRKIDHQQLISVGVALAGQSRFV